MLKKILVGSAIAAGGTGLLMGTSAIAYLRMAASSVREGIKQNIPIEVEIKQARGMIAELRPEIAENLRLIAREEVEVSRLTREVDSRTESLAKARQEIKRLKDDLEVGSTRYVYAGRKYTQEQVRENLGDRFERFKTQDATASKMRGILEAREKNLEACRRKLDGMLAAKRQLEVEIENMQARLTMVQVAQNNSQVSVNDSHLSRTRQLIDDIRTRIDVEEKLVNTEGILDDTIQLDEKTPEDLLEQITAYFGVDGAMVESLARK